jgi:hypothetical protein
MTGQTRTLRCSTARNPSSRGNLIGMCSWEGSEPPKLADRVQILASLLMATRLASRPWSVTESHATLRRSQTRFDSWRGHSIGARVAPDSSSILPASVSDARRSSKPQGRVRFPGGGLSESSISRPRSVTDPHTTLRRSGTRFNSWRGHPSEALRPTPEPDGQATGCNPVQVGSTPTGVFLVTGPINVHSWDLESHAFRGSDRRLMSARIQRSKRSCQERPFPRLNSEGSP